jgi:mxaJ protein
MRRVLLVLAAIGAACGGTGLDTPDQAGNRALRVCADPNNLPFSNDKLEGFENRLAELVGGELQRPIEYFWWAQRRGFIRNTLQAGECDVVMGVPAAFDRALTTRPYYRGSYVFVARASRRLHLSSLDDPRLRGLRIGVQLIGDDFANTPPAHALSARGLTRNIVGYSVLGDYGRPNPPAAIVSAVADGEVDAAVVWGPLAGYFAARQPASRRLELSPVTPAIDPPFLPFVFDIAMGVRRGDTALRDALDLVLTRRRADVDRILAEFRVVGDGSVFHRSARSGARPQPASAARPGTEPGGSVENRPVPHP